MKKLVIIGLILIIGAFGCSKKQDKKQMTLTSDQIKLEKQKIAKETIDKYIQYINKKDIPGILSMYAIHLSPDLKTGDYYEEYFNVVDAIKINLKKLEVTEAEEDYLKVQTSEEEVTITNDKKSVKVYKRIYELIQEADRGWRIKSIEQS